ncbi:WbuC family cupin fold metalloprotein [Curvibacter delicatus]|uniref:WbuC family cupin fold metalloprotein n=1 Tax=Curvibacter delicatus TaxID=80879 RepID=UPI00082A54C5|nr:WbuC family cupin fold metalloprotein [Curvibacter delicatus]
MNIRRFDIAFLNDLVRQAESSPRLRQHANLHASYAEPCQRLFNAIGVESYIRPHRHMADPKTETLVAVRGRMTLVLFDEQGRVIRALPFGAGSSDEDCDAGVELSPGTWHTVLADLPGSVLFEVKAGPFDLDLAKELASWAPAEGTAEVAEYLRELRRAAHTLLKG